MKKKKPAKRINFSLLAAGLLGMASLLIIYLVQATDKLIKIQAANAEAARRVTPLVIAPTGASCGT